MFDLLKDTIKFYIKRRVERGHGSWGFIFPAMLVLVLVLWTLRTTVLTMEYQTTSGTEQSATETDGEVADVDGLDGETVMLAAETDAEESDGGIMLLSADEDESDTESNSDGSGAESSTDSETDNNSTESSTSSESVTYSAADVTYDETTESFKVNLTVEFEFLDPYSDSDYYVGVNGSNVDTPVTDTENYTQVYKIQLPDDVIVPDSLLSGVYNGTWDKNPSVTIFKYYYVAEKDEDGNTTYYLYLVFASKDNLTSWGYSTDSTLDGYVAFSGSISSDAYDSESDSIRIYDSDEETQNLLFTVSGSDITYPGSSTTTENISVIKTGSYDPSTSTVTYTITVYSEKGTGDTIELTDYFTNSGLSEILRELGDITVTSTTVTYTSYKGEDYNVTASTDTTNWTKTLTTVGDSSSDTPYYYTDENGTIHIVLAGLKAYSGDGTEGSTTANAYVITYTYKVDPDYQTTYTGTNSVTASTEYAKYENESYTISDTDTATVYVKGSTVLSKTGSYDSSTGEVTWTITVGDGTSDLAGYVLSDDMIAGLAVGDINITDTSSSGSTVSACYAVAATDEDGNVTYTYYSAASLETESAISNNDPSGYSIIYVLDKSTTDEEGNYNYAVSAIIFNSGTQYTITYTTSVDSTWTSQTVTNTATLTYEGDEGDKEGDSYTSTYSMYTTGADTNAFQKSLTNATESESTDDEGNTTVTLTLSWTSTFTVPSTGIPAGTVFTDYVSSYSGSGVHYITYNQASTIVSALETAWGSDTIKIEFCTSADTWSTGSTWVSLDDDDSGDTVYYQFRFTLLKDIVYDDSSSADSGKVTTSTDTEKNTIYSAKTITYSYETTALTAGYDSNTYYNTLSDGSVSQSASHTWYDKVVKYGTDTSGNITGTDETSFTTTVDDDGNITVSWIVRLVVDSNTTTYTVTDILPADMTLSALYVSKYGNYNYSSISISDSSDSGDSGSSGSGTSGVTTTLNGIGTFTYSSDSTDTVDEESVTTAKLEISGISSDVNMLYLKYTCTYTVKTDDDSGEDNGSTEEKTYTFTNSVTVTTNNSTDYGSASQTTTVTVEETSDDSADMTKTSAFDSANNILTYTVNINPDAKTYTDANGDAYSDLTVTDSLSYYSFPGAGMIRSATLITSALKLVDADTGEELDSSEYSWTYSEDVVTYDWGYTVEYITDTITLTVPNSRHLILTYEYSFTIIQSGTWTEYTTNVTNTATLSAESETIYETTPISDSSQLSEVLTYGQANSGGVGYTIYKVDEDNFSTRLSDAEFTLYMYDSGSENFIAVGTFTTGSGGSVTISGTPVYSDEGTTSTLVSYTVTVADGETVTIPVDTICFLVETAAPEDYKLDDTKYYFYYGSSVSAEASDCYGYTSAAADAKNMVISYSNYITNEHSSDYYAAKTSISVLKKWFDANGEEYEKSDGSITFALYRVLQLTDGTITSASALESGDTSGSSSSSGSDNGVYLSWQLRYNNWTSYVTYEEGKAKVTAEDNIIYFNFYYSGISQYGYTWYTPVTLSVVKDSGTETMATIAEGSTFSYTILKDYESVVKSITYSDGTYIFELCVTDSMEIICDAASVYSYSLSSYVMSASVTTASDDSGSGSTSDDDSDSDDDSLDTETTGTVYRLNFSDLYDADDFSYDSESKSYADITIKGKYGWTDDEKEKLTTDGMTSGDSGFFQIYATGSSDSANLSFAHGTASYDIDGDGTVDTDEAEMDVCLKMENSVGTTIKFTSTEGGYLTMVFNSDGSGNSVKLTDTDEETSEVLTPNQSLYVVYEYLEAGEYTITYNQSCYLFYIAFAEGAEEEEEDTDAYIHNFNDGLTSSFYTISGSLSYNYGTVSYDDIIASQCLKMNSSASITFTSTEAGTIYLILTNPKGASKVGVTLDGEEVYATATQTADSQGYRIYTIMQRVEAGTHTITRISGTEVMLYYIAYMADDYGGNEWGTNNESTALANLTTDEQTTYKAYAELVDTITISASTDWAWYSSILASEYVDTETGVVKGNYLYYLVEVAVNGEAVNTETYTVTYLNDDGIKYGSIGISNAIVKSSVESTAVTLQKSWAAEDGSDVSDAYTTSGASITYSLYAIMTLDDNADSLSAGDSYSREFTANPPASDSFYTVTGSRSNNGTSIAGESYPVTYETSSTEYGLKLDSGGSVTFTAPATDGTLTLVFSTYNREGSTVTAMYGPNFSVTGPDGTITYTYKYNSSTRTGTLTFSGGSDPYSATCTSYSTTDNAAVFTLTLASAGEYTVGRGTSECYLHYIEYAYQYCNLVEGVLIQTGTLEADTTDSSDSEETTTSEEETATLEEGTTTSEGETTASEENTDTEETTWSKKISGLPKNIYDEDGNKIGTYSYYVKETGVTLYVNGETVALTADSSGNYYYEYTTDDEAGKYTVNVSLSQKASDGGSTVSTTTPDNGTITSVTAGTLSITNTVSLTSTAIEETYVLPGTGGTGTIFYYVIADFIFVFSAAAIFIRSRRRGCE